MPFMNKALARLVQEEYPNYANDADDQVRSLAGLRSACTALPCGRIVASLRVGFSSVSWVFFALRRSMPTNVFLLCVGQAEEYATAV